MAINDLIELTNSLPAGDVLTLDDGLAEKRLPTLTEMRVRFSRGVGRVVRRGHIRDEVEYYAVRNAAELSDKSDTLWSLLAAYEEGTAP